MSTKYVIRDWASATEIKNDVNPNLRINVGIYHNTENQSIDGYSIEIYDKSKKTACCCENGIIYKFDVDVTVPDHCSYSTQEAIDFLNNIGFICEFDYSVFNVSKEVLDQLTYLYGLGYKSIVRIVRPWCAVYLSVDPESDVARRLTYLGINDALKYFDVSVSKVLNYRNYLFLPPNTPTPIDQIMKNLIDADAEYVLVQPED